jgi:hypothetical protein
MGNKTQEAAFIQSAVSGRGDSKSVVSALPALNQVQHPLGWMACSITLGQIEESMREWVLINTVLTVNMFCNREFVREVEKMTRVMVHTNAGPFTVKEQAKLPWCDLEVWFDLNAITNVLSFAILQEKFLIIYDNSKADAFIVKTPKGDLKFELLPKNLYVHKPRGNGIKLELKQETSMLSTLEENKTFYTNRQVERAKRARALARALGCPSDADLQETSLQYFQQVATNVKSGSWNHFTSRKHGKNPMDNMSSQTWWLKTDTTVNRSMLACQLHRSLEVEVICTTF